jgi:glycosyltransferase involved in cell wall biosynthesis
LAGAHPDIQAYYNAADCFVLSSAWEGFGLVLAEAMACGLPVISTDAGGCAEVVDQPQYMVPIKDEEKLRDKMIEIMNKSISERNDIGSKNSLIAKKYDIHSIIDKWESLYMSKI